MKKKNYIIFIIILVLVWALPIVPISKRVKICYDGILKTSVTQLFFDCGEGYNEYLSYRASNTEDEAILSISTKMLRDMHSIRIDMGDEQEDFILDSIQIYKNGIKTYEFKGKEILNYISDSYNIHLEENSDGRLFCSTGIDSQIYMNENFKELLANKQYYNINEKIIISCILLFMMLVFWLVKSYGCQILCRLDKLEKEISEKMESFTINKIEKVKQFLKSNRYSIILLLVYTLITYGYEITNWTLTIDEEIVSYMSKWDCFKGWIRDGRWGLGILKLILPSHKVLPYFNGICAVVVLIICALVFSYIIQKYISNNTITAIVSTLFITMPLHSYYLMFDTFSVEISLGFLCAILSGYFCTEASIKKSRVQSIVSVALLTLSVAIYQLYFLVYASVVCIVIVLNLVCDYRKISEEKDIKSYYFMIIRSIIILIVSMILYAVINLIMQSVFGKSNYVDGYFRWSYVEKSICIEQMKIYLETLFTHPKDLFIGGNILLFCYMIYFIHFIILMIKMKGKRMIVLLTYAGLSLSMCFQYILFAGHIPIRSQQVLVIYVCFAAVSLSLIFEKKFWRTSICLLSCMLALYQASMVVELFYSENIRQKQDENLLNRIIVEIEELDLGEKPDYPIVFVGEHSWNGSKKIETEQFCLSMFDTGQIGRVYVWLNVLGYNYIQPNEEQQHKAENIAQDMPVWPCSGSVSLVDDVVIVNLGADG